jgi:hypothetical protein
MTGTVGVGGGGFLAVKLVRDTEDVREDALHFELSECDLEKLA